MTDITGKTSILMMLADPVAHVRGSALINATFAQLGLNAVIVPLHVLPKDLAGTLQAARQIQNLAGLGITIPHKIATLSLVDTATDAAKRIGAVNWIRRNADGTLTGDNIDGQSFVAGLAANGFSVAGKRVLVVGAGGVGRAIAFAVADAGALSLDIANRTPDKASDLAAEIGAAVPGCTVAARLITDPEALAGLDLLINATSLGMHPAEPLPIAIDGLGGETTVAEVVVNPPMTPLLKAAAARGCPVMGGDQMLRPQPALVAKFLGLGQPSRGSTKQKGLR